MQSTYSDVSLRTSYTFLLPFTLDIIKENKAEQTYYLLFIDSM